MNDALLMGKVDGAGECLDQAGRHRERLQLPADFGGQTAPLHELQAKVGHRGADTPRSPFAVVVNMHDVRVLQLGGRLGFPAQTRQVPRRHLGGGTEHLQGHQAVQADLAGLIDHAHAALAQLAQNLIPRQGWPGGCGRRRMRPLA
jgi:hypothetical protein